MQLNQAHQARWHIPDKGGSRKCVILAGITYAILIILAYLTFGSVLVHAGKSIERNSDQGTAFIKQMVQDWDRQAYTNVIITDEWYCPEDHEELYSHVWYGARNGCDCNGICDPYMTGCYQFNMDVQCTYNQTEFGWTSLKFVKFLSQVY